MKVSYSAPAKVVLSGEHAVVYGKPALVAAIDMRLTFTVKDGKMKNKNKGVKEIEKVVRKYVSSTLHLPSSIFNKEYIYAIKSDIPIGRGVGSSAAFAVAGVAAFLEFFSQKQHPQKVINNLAYKVEKKFTKNPSGVDNTASAFGGLIYFRKEFEFLKGIYKVSFKIPKNIEEKLYLIDSGKPKESTAQTVAHVGALYNKDVKEYEKIMHGIEKVTKRLVISLIKEDKEFFKKQIIDNQQLLNKLEVSSKSANMLVKKLSKYGAGKITGGGGIKKGSGYILFYEEDINGLKKYCKKNKIKYFKFKQSYEGVKREI